MIRLLLSKEDGDIFMLNTGKYQDSKYVFSQKMFKSDKNLQKEYYGVSYNLLSNTQYDKKSE